LWGRVAVSTSGPSPATAGPVTPSRGRSVAAAPALACLTWLSPPSACPPAHCAARSQWHGRAGLRPRNSKIRASRSFANGSAARPHCRMPGRSSATSTTSNPAVWQHPQHPSADTPHLRAERDAAARLQPEDVRQTPRRHHVLQLPTAGQQPWTPDAYAGHPKTVYLRSETATDRAIPAPAADPAPVPTRHRSCPSRTGAGAPAGRTRSRTYGRDSHTQEWTDWTRQPRPRDTSTTGPLASRWTRQPRVTKRPILHASAPAN
jgi:hypothetical protein